MRLSATKANSTNQYRGLGEQLYDLGGARPTLDLNFANNESLVDSVTGKNLVTYTRSSSATYVDGDGNIQTAANDVPRFDHDPVTGESLGLLIEQARTNEVKYSAVDLDNNWENAGTQSNVDLSLNELGVFPGVRVVSDGQSWHGVRTNTTNTPIALTADTTYTVSTWYKDGDINPSGKIRLAIKKAGVSQNCFLFRDSSDPLNISDYTINNNATHGTISNITVTEHKNSVYKITYNFVPASTADHQVIISTQSITAGDSVIALGVQVEEGQNPSSYIPTSGSTVTRATDNVSITGTNFSSWYNTTDQKGTAYVEGIPRFFTSTHHVYFSFSDGSLDNEIRFFKNKSNNKEQFRILASNTVQLSQVYEEPLYGQNRKGVLAFELNNTINALDGTKNNADTSVTVPVVDQVQFGVAPGTVGPLMTIKRFTYWPFRVSNDTVVRLTE